MENKIKRIIKWFLLICLLGVCIYCPYQYYALDKYFCDVDVPGIVYGKSGYTRGKYKSTKIYTDYMLAVKPNNPDYKNYSVKVNFETFSDFNIGDKVSFKRPLDTVQKNFKYDANLYEMCMFITWFIYAVLGLTLGIFILVWLFDKDFKIFS